MKQINWKRVMVLTIAAIGLTLLMLGVCIIGGEPIPDTLGNTVIQMVLGSMLTLIGLVLFYSANRTLEDMKEDDQDDYKGKY